MNDTNIKVSIITVVYNGAATIEQTILSVLGQSYKYIEYIVIDGLSTDGTQEIVKKYQESIIHFISEKDNGIYDAMNKGIQMATGEIVGIINSDDWYTCDAIENVVRYFVQEKGDIVYGRWHNVYKDGTEAIFSREPLENLMYKMIIPHPTVFIKKEVYEKYGLFDLEYQLAADYDLLLRLYYGNLKFGYIDRTIAYFRAGGRSTQEGMLASKEAKTIAMKYLPKCKEKKSILEKIEEKYSWDYFSEAVRNEDLLIKILETVFQKEEFDLIIFGTGIWGKRCYEKLKGSKIKVTFFVDNASSKWKQEFCGMKVYNPNRLKSMKVNLLVAVKENGNVIKKQLSELNNPDIKYVTLKELKDMFYQYN